MINNTGFAGPKLLLTLEYATENSSTTVFHVMTQVSHHCLPLNHCEIFFKPWHHLAFALEECTVYTLFSPLFLSPAPAIIKVKLQDTNDAVINVHIYIWVLQMTSKVFTLIFLLGCH